MSKFDVVYSDVNFVAGVEPSEIVTNEQAINQNIAMIFDTPYKSKWYRPRIGSNIHKYLFEPIDQTTADRIRFDMLQALSENGEWRVVFDAVLVLPDPENEQYFVMIRYRAPDLEDRQYTFQFNLVRGYQ